MGLSNATIPQTYAAGSASIVQVLKFAPMGAVPAAAIANYLAGSFIALVRWWLDEGGLYTPAQMDAIFQALVAPGLERALLNES